MPRRGQPLFALAGVMLFWVAARAFGPVDALLETPLPLPPTVAGRVEPEPVAAQVVPDAFREALPAQVAAREFAPVQPVSAPNFSPPPAPIALRMVERAPNRTPTSTLPPAPPASSIPEVAPPPAPVPFGAVPADVRAARRWSADAWVLWRDKASASAALVGSGTYGASQAGAVLRYRLAPESSVDPRAYLRVTTVLTGDTEYEAAAGLAVRPVRDLPVDLLVEGRVLRYEGDPRLRPSETRVRPAAMAVIGPPPVPLPLNAKAEAYAQIGYVGGKGATSFADGQLRIVTEASVLDRFRIEAGLGAWGGAQKGVERLDVGPTVAARFPIGGGLFARAGLDWRQRVAGRAEPDSGPVLTVSAGF
ncbi:hypothetical protein [Croceicoccus gelatinilyticus]|uniref:hypothetical protein n=1 Tax=Croceicoccus gelatinilyticus TaxID=2835536 RepID=UPI001BCC8D97|nr:hypothetical protein [Croceicoccus gelatinilyticus]